MITKYKTPIPGMMLAIYLTLGYPQMVAEKDLNMVLISELNIALQVLILSVI